MRRRTVSALLFALGIGALALPAFGGPKPKPKDEKPLAREWRSIEGKHWQVAGPPGEDPATTDAREGNRGSCSAGMIEVRGKMKTIANGDHLQQSICKKWITRTFPERCAEFDREKWLAMTAKVPLVDKHFCIDRYEYPNRKGEYPIILLDWHEAGAICKGQGKRLCTEDEWTFACEGEEAMPYPYGYVRDPDACVVDKTWRPFVSSWALYGRASEQAKRELDGLWQGVASGTQPKCKSPFGVYDMIGNVDEWTRSSRPGRQSILKGGYWGPVRTRCRPTTRAHGETHVFYQESVRCCADLK